MNKDVGYTYEYIIYIEKEENYVILMIWVDPEDIMLNEISQTEKDNII